MDRGKRVSITFKLSRLTKVLETNTRYEMGRNKKAGAAAHIADIPSHFQAAAGGQVAPGGSRAAPGGRPSEEKGLHTT